MFARMAVADVAVQLGPRNRRRLAKGAITLGVAGVIVAAAMLLTHWANQSAGPGLSAAEKRAISNGQRATPIIDKISNLPLGATKQQVRRALGRPTRVVGHCWQYAVNERNYTVHNGKILDGGMWNAAKLCFGWPAGALTSKRAQVNGTWLPPM